MKSEHFDMPAEEHILFWVRSTTCICICETTRHEGKSEPDAKTEMNLCSEAGKPHCEHRFQDTCTLRQRHKETLLNC